MPWKQSKEGTICIYHLPQELFRSSCAVLRQESLISNHCHSTTHLLFATSPTCPTKPNSLKLLFFWSKVMYFDIQSLFFIFFAYPPRWNYLLMPWFKSCYHIHILQTAARGYYSELQSSEIFLLRHFLSRGNALNQAYFRLYFPPDKSKMEHDFNSFEEREWIWKKLLIHELLS